MAVAIRRAVLGLLEHPTPDVVIGQLPKHAPRPANPPRVQVWLDPRDQAQLQALVHRHDRWKQPVAEGLATVWAERVHAGEATLDPADVAAVLVSG